MPIHALLATGAVHHRLRHDLHQRRPRAVEVDQGLALAVVQLADVLLQVDAGEGKLGRAGLLVLNPPFGFDTDMRDILGVIAPRLPGGKAAVELLAGKP